MGANIEFILIKLDTCDAVVERVDSEKEHSVDVIKYVEAVVILRFLSGVVSDPGVQELVVILFLHVYCRLFRG